MARDRGTGADRDGGVPAAAAPLYALPPSRFVPERDALAKALAAGGDPAAAIVKRLRRPAGIAWVLNRLARDRPDDVAALLGAGDRLAAGQRRAIEGGGAEALREAEGALRDAARALRDAAGPILAETGRAAAPAVLARIELALRVAATAAPEERDALRAGTLSHEPELGTGLLGEGGALEGPPAAFAARSRSAAAAGERGRAPEPGRRGRGGEAVRARERDEARASAAQEARREREERARAAEEARKERERVRAIAGARRDLERAERDLARARDAVEAAFAREREARARLAAAETEAERRRDALRRLGAEA